MLGHASVPLASTRNVCKVNGMYVCERVSVRRGEQESSDLCVCTYTYIHVWKYPVKFHDLLQRGKVQVGRQGRCVSNDREVNLCNRERKWCKVERERGEESEPCSHLHPPPPPPVCVCVKIYEM